MGWFSISNYGINCWVASILRLLAITSPVDFKMTREDVSDFKIKNSASFAHQKALLGVSEKEKSVLHFRSQQVLWDRSDDVLISFLSYGERIKSSKYFL